MKPVADLYNIMYILSSLLQLYYSTTFKKTFIHLRYTTDSFESFSIPDTDKYDVLIIEYKTKTGICFVSFSFGQIQITSNLVQIIKHLENFDKS